MARIRRLLLFLELLFSLSALLPLLSGPALAESTPAHPNPPQAADHLPATAIQLSWTSDAISFDVTLWKKGVTTPIRTWSVNTHFVETPGLATGTDYVWQVVANPGDTETPGPVWEFRTTSDGRSIPYNPYPLNGATGVGLDPTLAWESADSATYRIYLGKTDSPELVGELSVSTLKVYNLERDTNYYWLVEKVYSDGSVIRGPLWMFRTSGNDITPTVTPTGTPTFTPTSTMEWGTAGSGCETGLSGGPAAAMLGSLFLLLRGRGRKDR